MSNFQDYDKDFKYDLDPETSPDSAEVEPLQWYRKGGYHPIELGDYLDSDDRFRVVHKLGHGGFATVWLCWDLLTGKWRAVKVLVAAISNDDCAELNIKRLFDGIPEQDLEDNGLVMPLEHFYIDGPNGTHLCLVLPFLGTQLSWIFPVYGHCEDLMKHVCFQMVKALAYLHSLGICHGDFRPDNILFRIADGVDEWPEDKLLAVLEPPVKVAVQYGHWVPIPEGETEGKINLPKGLPKYLIPRAQIDYGTGLCSTKIAVTDFGLTYPYNQPPPGPGTGIPELYASPEALFGSFQDMVGPAADVWALACTISKTRLGYVPFGDLGSHFLDLLKSMETNLGPLPRPYRDVFRAWDAEDKGITIEELGEESDDLTVSVLVNDKLETSLRKRRYDERGGTGMHMHYLMLGTFPLCLETFEAQNIYEQALVLSQKQENVGTLPKYKPSHDAGMLRHWQLYKYKMTRTEADELLDLFKKVFVWDPAERATAAELLEHPWFQWRKSPHVRPYGLLDPQEWRGMFERVVDGGEVATKSPVVTSAIAPDNERVAPDTNTGEKRPDSGYRSSGNKDTANAKVEYDDKDIQVSESVATAVEFTKPAPAASPKLVAITPPVSRPNTLVNGKNSKAGQVMDSESLPQFALSSDSPSGTPLAETNTDEDTKTTSNLTMTGTDEDEIPDDQLYAKSTKYLKVYSSKKLTAVADTTDNKQAVEGDKERKSPVMLKESWKFRVEFAPALGDDGDEVSVAGGGVGERKSQSLGGRVKGMVKRGAGKIFRLMGGW